MDHKDHVNLLKAALVEPGGAWADLGAGSGSFTLALRELVGPETDIYALDKDRAALGELERAYQARFGDSQNLHILPVDFTRALHLPPLDGVVMANSLHYYKNPKKDAEERGGRGKSSQKIIVPPRSHLHRAQVPVSASGSTDKISILQHVGSLLKPRGTLLLVEYNVDSGNPWVPYPISFETFRAMAPQAGFSEPRLLGRVPSRFLREIYSAVAQKEELKH